MSTKVQFSSERVNAVINAVNAECSTLGAVIRNFVAVCATDDYARYMLDTITGKPQSFVSMSVNAIKVAVIAKYPYKDGNTLLRKDGDLFIPISKYTGDIVRRAFHVSVGHTKTVDVNVVPATEEQIKEHNAKKEAAKKEAAKKEAAKKEAAKAKADNYENFYNEIMNAAESDIINIVRKYKALAAGTDVAAANVVLG